MRVSIAGVSLAFAIIASAAPAFACDRNHTGAPQVALALSGGGALAASQVGAIKALEEIGVPIHCVLGTSMGAVVGALYASGYNGQELREVFIDADWGAITTGAISYRNLGFRDKEKSKDYLSEYVIGIGKDGVVLPPGASSLRGMRSYLRDLTSQVTGVSNFDNLPIQYRAMGTDLATGESVSFASGDMVDSALASMAVPGLYPPQRIGNRIFVDGGMSKQVPIDVAKELGADIIIVIDTTLPPQVFDKREPTIVDTVMQLTNLTVWRNYQEQIKLLQPGDVLIHPDMTEFSVSGFNRMHEGYEVGYKATMAQRERLAEIARIAAPRPPPSKPPPETISIASVAIENGSIIHDSMISSRLAIKPGDTVTQPYIENAVADVAALGAFDTVDYSLTPGAAGTALEIITTPTETNQHVRVGVDLSTTLGGDSYYRLLARYTLKPMSPTDAELNITGEVGSDFALSVEYAQLFGPSGRWFIQPYFGWSRRTVPFDIGDVRISERRDETFETRLEFGRELGQWGLASLTAGVQDVDTDVRVGLPVGFDGAQGTFAFTTARFAADTMNAVSFPTSGLAADARLVHLWNLENSDQTNAGALMLAAAHRFGGFGAFVRFEGGFLEADADSFPSYKLGGFKRLSGFTTNSLPATDYGLVRFELFTRLGGGVEQTFGLPIYIGGTLEGAKATLDFRDLTDNDYDAIAGSLYGAIMTPIGPAYLAYGLGEGGAESIYFYMGRAF
jgi:NTE family protein